MNESKNRLLSSYCNCLQHFSIGLRSGKYGGNVTKARLWPETYCVIRPKNHHAGDFFRICALFQRNPFFVLVHDLLILLKTLRCVGQNEPSTNAVDTSIRAVIGR